MAIRQDCPICGRKGNEGVVCKDADDDKFTAIEAALGGVAGFCFGGPAGAALGAMGAHKMAKWITRNNQKTSDGYIWYRFNCMNPACKHTWVSKVKE